MEKLVEMLKKVEEATAKAAGSTETQTLPSEMLPAWGNLRGDKPADPTQDAEAELRRTLLE